MADMMKENECFQKDYQRLYDKGTWNKDEIAMMKDLKKLMYYNLVIDAMENGGSYPGSEHMPEMSYMRGRDAATGRYMSRTMNNGSGLYYPPYMDGNSWNGNNMNSSNHYNDGMNMSGRRYYDSEKEKAIHKLHHMMENEDNAEKKNALKLAVTVLEEQK